MIDIQKHDVSFYFVVPSQYLTLAKERIINTWNKCKVELVTMPTIPKGLVYSLGYENKDQLSLDVDKKSNYPLNNILSTIDIMAILYLLALLAISVDLSDMQIMQISLKVL